jgi:hypothetical protein
MILWRPCHHRQVSVFQQLASQLLPEDGKVEAWIPWIADQEWPSGCDWLHDWLMIIGTLW